MRDLFSIYFRYSIVINIIFGAIVYVFAGYICDWFTEPDAYSKLLVCLRLFAIYLPLFQLRVFLGTYLRSNQINFFTFVVSGLLYPMIITIVLLLTYLFKWFDIKALIFSFIFCDFIVVLLLTIKTEMNLRKINKLVNN